MPPRPPASQGLLQRLQSEPELEPLRLSAARALQEEGRPAEAAQLLLDRWRNLTAHEGPPLPCLCKKCIDLALMAASAGGLTFTRAFSAAAGRVLFYWVPDDLGVSKGLVASVGAELRTRLGQKRRRRRPAP